MQIRTAALTSGALVAFAANSILCRVALRKESIDPATFTLVRLLSGALLLWLIVAFSRQGEERAGRTNWRAAFALFAYAGAFSFAYITLDAGIGALILFALVQTTMIVGGIWMGERPRVLQWLGLAVAMGGFAWLVLPGASAPSAVGSSLMALAGIAWGVYSLIGWGSSTPVLDNARSFMCATGLAVVLFAVSSARVAFSAEGLAWAALSGAVASGIGYAVWYAALRSLTATTAAIAQLSVPVLVVAAGVVLLSEPVTLRLVVSGIVILSGVALAIVRR